MVDLTPRIWRSITITNQFLLAQRVALSILK
jgi:hypothetical protein